MARPFPWISRLPDIRRSVSNSKRSGYTRRELEVLFGISARAAGRLLELLAGLAINNSHMVERDKLQTFLESVATAPSVPRIVEELRGDKANLSRVKMRHFVPHDQDEVPVTSLPQSIRLRPGRLEIEYVSYEDLLLQLYLLSKAAQDDPLAFEARCEPRQAELSDEARDARYIQSEIERMDREIAARRAGRPPNAETPPHPRRDEAA
jgi:hypothetical protein